MVLEENTDYEIAFDGLADDINRIVDYAKPINDGNLYESVILVYPDVALIDMLEFISIRIHLNHSTVEDDSIAFFYIVSKICESCNIEDGFSDITFVMIVDDVMAAILIIQSYESPYSFTSNYVPLNLSYVDALRDVYEVGISSEKLLEAFKEEISVIAVNLESQLSKEH